ncbi:unnamed protein product, partial [Hapterophycus canaliculatus]
SQHLRGPSPPSRVSHSPLCRNVAIYLQVVGVGGGGGNAVVRMTQQNIPGVEFWCLNTDAQQAIHRAPESIKTLQIGNDVTRGLGAGGVPDIGKKAAQESRDEIAQV